MLHRFFIIGKCLGKTEVLEFVKEMKPHDHAIMFYTEPRDKQLVLFTYIKAALEKGGAAVYLFSQESAVQITTVMKEFGVTTDKYLQKGALHLIDQSRQPLIDSEGNQAKQPKSDKKSVCTINLKGIQ